MNYISCKNVLSKSVIVDMQNLDDKCYTPQTNMAEMKHASWLAREGYKSKIGLYDAIVSDLANNLLQQSKRQAYLEGKYIGKGSGIMEMRDRAKSRSNVTPTPTNVSRNYSWNKHRPSTKVSWR